MSQTRERRLFNTAIRVLLRDLVHERAGLWFEDAKLDMLEDKVTPLLEADGLTSPLDLYYRLKDDDRATWNRLLDALSVQETYFWREIDQMRAVVDVLVPRWVEALRGRPLRIWSVPCATGEEPLTLAMLLDEAGWFARAPIELHASDVSSAALARARRGCFRERAFRALPGALRERYFTPDGGEWRVTPALHARVQWSQVNVAVRAEADPFADCPIIFCRNLFIYFSDASIRRLAFHLGARMPAGGALCLGVSESLLRITNVFELQSLGSAFVYVKPGAPA
jgi:chemotaxis protein methyltransferase CheR